MVPLKPYAYTNYVRYVELMFVRLLLDIVVCFENFQKLQSHCENLRVVKTSYPKQLETLLFYPVRVRHILRLLLSLTPV